MGEPAHLDPHQRSGHVDGKGKEKTGTTFNWAIEGGTPNTLLRTGINKNSLKVGTEVVVRGYQSKDALCDVHAEDQSEDLQGQRP